jgi:hypothetical protein
VDLALAAAMPVGARGQNLAPEVLLLSRIERTVAREFSLLPDYTCVETVQRFHRKPGRAKMEPLGTVYLEVLYSGEKELYSAPGEGRFSEGHPSRFVAQGMMGNGDFALHLKSIFLDRTAQFPYRGGEEYGGRPAAGSWG